MTLLNRVSAFFLAALAIALIGYSVAFYVMARNYLVGNFDDGLHNALRILVASVEVEPDDAKWQPGEFSVEFDQATLPDVRWIITDEQGQVIDHSPQTSRGKADQAGVFAFAQQPHPATEAPVERGGWRMLQKQLNAPQPKSLSLREPHEYAGIRVTVARSRVALAATLRRLTLLVLLLPAVIWSVAAIGGRAYMRRALEPLRQMADRARSMTRADFALRLPVANSQDELAELGVAFNGLLDQLQRSYDQQQRFTGDAAHQLRTPLAVLQGQIEVALRRPRSTAEHERTLGLLAEQVDELRQIVESLLFLARAEDEALAPARESLDLATWTNTWLERWNSHPRRGDLAIRTSNTPPVDIVPVLLSQLLENLVNNAFKYSAAGTPVTIAVERAPDGVELSVADRGMGIDQASQAAIFEPFFRTAEARRAGVAGTGLGLAVAARIAAALGGTLRCDSTPGAGSRFSLLLPR